MDVRRNGASRPLGALISQGIVAGSSLVLQLVALSQLGKGGLGSFALLFGILITVNSMQSGWIGDSLTVLDRFEPGYRRALIQSQVAVLGLTFVITTIAALPVGGVDLNTAILFGLASVTWVFEETLRRLLIARREFWKLVVNDASFAIGSFGLIGFVAVSGNQFTLETFVLALFAGAVVAIGVGVAQLPRVELSRGILGPSRLGELSSFAFWRAAQIGLRPGSQAIVRFVVVGAASVEALGELETARLLLAPVLTAVNGAGVYLLPTYSAQYQRGERFRPAVPTAMFIVAAMAAGYGVVAVIAEPVLSGLLPGGSEAVTTTAILAWAFYSVGFGAGIPAGNAMVSTGRSRVAFRIRCIDAVVGIVAAAAFAILGWVDAVPAGLAVGAVLGAALLLRALRTVSEGQTGSPTGARATIPPHRQGARAGADETTPLVETDVLGPDLEEAPWVWEPTSSTPSSDPRPNVAPSRPAARNDSIDVARPALRRRERLQERLLWLLPLVMIVATEYKVRRRSIDDALAGSIDPLIAVELLVYGLIGAWAIWRLAPTTPRLTPLLVVMWGYILTTAVSALYSTFPLLGLARAVQLVIIGAVVHVVATQGTASTMMRLIHGWIVLMSVSILAGLAYVAPTTNAQVGRFTWLSVHSVSAGSMLAISACCLFGLWLQAGARTTTLPLPWPRAAYGVLLVLQLVFLLMTRTRGSIGGAFVALAVMAWVWSGNKMRPQLLLGSIVAGGALILAFGETIFDFLTRGESAEQIGTFNRRTEIWTLAWDSFLSHPLHGLGFTSAKGVFFDETGLGGAHNAFINVMIDVGLVGLVWWVLLIVATIVVLNRQSKHHRVSPERAGAAGTARADHLILLGFIVTSLLNSVTTEGLGAGVNVSALWWFIAVAWLTILDRPPAGEPQRGQQASTSASPDTQLADF